LNKGVLVMWTW